MNITTNTTKNSHFRDGTYLETKKIIFNLLGGIGDYINYMAALKYLAHTFDQIEGHVVVRDVFIEVARNVLKDTGWVVHSNDPQPQFEPPVDLKQPWSIPINPTMMHLTDLGFLYYAEVNPPPPKWDFYPQLDLSSTKLHGSVKNQTYAVMTPGTRAASRTIPAPYFNKIKEYIISLGIKPVFLGSVHANIKSVSPVIFPDEYDYSGGINLLNKTSLMEAAKIMESAQFVIGLDNGLLHLAAMTEAPIVFGYTIAGPIQREPKRKKGVIYNVTVSDSELTCIHCQEKFKFVGDHSFEKCFYGDLKCLELLSAEKFIKGIDSVLKN